MILCAEPIPSMLCEVTYVTLLTIWRRRSRRGFSPLALFLLTALLPTLFPRPARAEIGGSWIWSSAERNPVNAYAYFRRAFSLEAAPAAAAVRVTADTRYALYVNGRRVGRGPVRSHTADLAYDTWDVAAYLQPGRNVLAALVHHAGESTFRNQQGRAGFLCDLTVTAGGKTSGIRTDAAWKALASEAWDRAQPRMNIALGFAEVFDARRALVGWETVDFDDAGWPAATVLGRSGVAPWVRLTPADIPPNRETVLRPARVLDVLQVEPPPDASWIPFSRLHARNNWAVGYAGTYLYAPRDTDVVLQVGGDDGLRLWINGALVLEKSEPRPGCPAQDAVLAPLKAGWNHVIVKSVKLLGPWNLFFTVAGPGAGGVYASADRSPGGRDTWRVSPVYEFDGGKGIPHGLGRVFASEDARDWDAWTTVQAPTSAMDEPAPAMRFESRQPAPPGRVVNAGSLASANGAATFRSEGRLDGAVTLDMGRHTLGYPVLRVRGARGGEVLDVGYVEALEDAAGRPVSPASGAPGIVNPARGNVYYADRFVCRPGDNVFEPFAKRGFRYMQIDLRTAGASLTLETPEVVEALYPVEERGSFASSDERLNRIWEAGRETLRLNMDDAYTDCIWRERTQWWGDTHIGAHANYYAFGDTALIRRALVLAAQSQDAEGIVRGLFPTDWDGARLPSYSLLWIISLWDYYVHTGDASLFPTLTPVMHRLLGFFAGKVNPSLGLLDTVPYWVFIDWAPGMDGQRVGASASLNAFYYRALLAAADISRAAGDPAGAARYAAEAAALKTAFSRFWNPGVGLYDDVLNSGKPSGRYTEQANSLAIAYGLAPVGQETAILQRLATRPGVVKTGTPYFGAYVLDAMAAAGRDADAVRYIRENWGRMLDWGSPTFWEMWEPVDSLTHSWSSGPTAYLPARVLGVRPSGPGWKEWAFSPALSGLQWARGRVPTPKGDIEAFWTMRPNGLTAEVTVPEGTTAVVRIPNAGLEQARWLVSRGMRSAPGLVAESAPGHFAVRLTLPGHYTIIASQPGTASPSGVASPSGAGGE